MSVDNRDFRSTLLDVIEAFGDTAPDFEKAGVKRIDFTR